MIADRHPFIVVQQRIVGAEQLADIGGVMDAHIEVGIIANRHRQEHLAAAAVMQEGLRSLAVDRIRQKIGKRRPQVEARCRGQRHQPGDAGYVLVPKHRQQARSLCAFETYYEIANSDTGARATVRTREHAEGQVLDREVCVAIGRLYPTLAGRIMSFVECHIGKLHIIGAQCWGDGRLTKGAVSGCGFATKIKLSQQLNARRDIRCPFDVREFGATRSINQRYRQANIFWQE